MVEMEKRRANHTEDCGGEKYKTRVEQNWEGIFGEKATASLRSHCS